jgi:hypothetical protein
VERKIYFYRMHVGTDEAGIPVTFDPRPVLRTIDTLPFVGSQERYLVDDESNAVCAWVDDVGAEPKIRLVRIRRAGLPQIEEAGLLSDLNLAVNAGLAEPVHVIFFPNNIVGADFNTLTFMDHDCLVSLSTFILRVETALCSLRRWREERRRLEIRRRRKNDFAGHKPHL